jgi:hypothetical protein
MEDRDERDNHFVNKTRVLGSRTRLCEQRTVNTYFPLPPGQSLFSLSLLLFLVLSILRTIPSSFLISVQRKKRREKKG